MRAFRMYRRDPAKIAATHNADQVNPPDEVQFEGVVFSDGTVAVRWCTAKASTSIWRSLDDLLAIHGHPEYGSELVWDEDELAGLRRIEEAHRRTNGELREEIKAKSEEIKALETVIFG